MNWIEKTRKTWADANYRSRAFYSISLLVVAFATLYERDRGNVICTLMGIVLFWVIGVFQVESGEKRELKNKLSLIEKMVRWDAGSDAEKFRKIKAVVFE